jgi:hypothetical protein
MTIFQQRSFSGSRWSAASRKFNQEFAPNLISVQSFNGRNFIGEHAKYQIEPLHVLTADLMSALAIGQQLFLGSFV